jgi:hypothetical protein
VLHTWGRQLQDHPHLHYLVPGGGISPDRKSWLATSDKFILPVEALSPIPQGRTFGFRAKFRAEMKKAQLLDQIPTEVWKQDWVVHCQAVGDGVHALKYLARYVFRVAISNRRLLSCQKGSGYFQLSRQKTGETRRVHLKVTEFIRRFLDHLLPEGPPLRLLEPHLFRAHRKGSAADCPKDRHTRPD